MSDIHNKSLLRYLGIDDDEVANIYTTNTDPLPDDDDSSSNNSEQNSYKSHYDLRILYDSWEEYENLREDFREFIPELLQNTDGMRNIFLFSENDDIRNKSPIEDEFNNALRKLVKFKNEPWVNEISRIIINALRGVYTTLNLMKLPLTEDESDELYRELAYGIIINIVLETRENMG